MPPPITDEEKIILTHQVYSLFTQYGFDGISMDEVARQIKLSKATIYKYFKSKEDIVRNMVDEVMAQLDALEFTTDGGIDSVLDSLSAIYFKAVVVAAYSSSKFITDLESKYPNILTGYMAALDNVQTRFERFYQRAIREGYCRDVTMILVGEQAKQVLPAIITPESLHRYDTTLTDVIKEYYKLLLCQLLSARYMDITGQESTYAFVDQAVEVLKGRFLVSQLQQKKM